MIKTTALNPISTPLNSTILIEASAGTGKTYTIASLYLRLLLSVGQHNFPQPLTVEQILVVTFTEAATQELKERIRQRIHLAKQQLLIYREKQDKSIFINTDNTILAELVEYITDLDDAIQRLHLAEQNMDLAAIYTIHGFCYRMLQQYAFNSGVHFNLELIKDESKLFSHLANEFWRQNFYRSPTVVANFIHQKLGSPQNVLNKIRTYLKGESIKVNINQPQLLDLSLQDFLQQYIQKKQNQLLEFKQIWLSQESEIHELILQEITKPYAKGEKKRIKRNPYNEKNVRNWFNLIHAWANNHYQIEPPQQLFKFAQSNLTKYAEEGSTPLCHPVFSQIEQLDNTDNIYDKIILYHYIQGVNQALLNYKADHNEIGFDDLLRLFKQALYAEQGEELAQLIRYQYPFAMIDEFQDTDKLQYHIFHKLYMGKKNQNIGFLMIGDPKQAIYKFRGADIFTYLHAAKQAKEKFTLNKNYRSEKNLVNVINQLFNFQHYPPFIYQDIDFFSVDAKEQQFRFVSEQKIQPPLACYIGNYSKTQLAEICADSIQNWLLQANQRTAYFNCTVTEYVSLSEENKLQAKNIAILVRNWQEAELVKTALQKRNIPAVYLSDRSNVFDSQEARELAFILAACLNPFNERNILNAISTSIFAFTSANILLIKQDESLLESWVSRFEKYKNIWLWQGVLPMLYQLLLDNDHNQLSIPEKLLSKPNGERRLTDLLHLAELLQQAASLNESEAALLRWFENQIQGDERDDEQQTRLASEQELVKIVTIHKSKGLEYDLVWLPFISLGMKEFKKNDGIYYDPEKQEVYWDIDEVHSDKIQKEYLAEEMRLFYVALTRAKYHLALALPHQFEEKGHWNALLYALTQGEIGEKASLTQIYNTQEYLEKLIQKIGKDNIAVYLDKEISSEILTIANSTTTILHATEFHRKIEQNWILSSFTGLSVMHNKNKQDPYNKFNSSTEYLIENRATFENVADYDNLSSVESEQLFLTNNNDWPDFPVNYTPVDFPGGVKIGTVLHDFFEKISFEQEIKTENVEKLCQTLQLNKEWFIPLQKWLLQIVNTPLLSEDQDLCLARISTRSCIKEMQFYLKLGSTFSVNQFNKILQKYHFSSGKTFIFNEIKGMVRGFIDLVFVHNGKYYLLDYKSNLLGNALQDYTRSQLIQVMEANHYDLQFLLYTLALHRYLKNRISDYHYEKYFGGSIYIFLRGMNGKSTDYGVFFNKPNWNLIQELELLFYA